MTEQVIRAIIRLGSQVYLRSERTSRVWLIAIDHYTDRLRGFPPQNGPASSADWLTSDQVQWHLANKPHNFTTTPPCTSGSTTTNP